MAVSWKPDEALTDVATHRVDDPSGAYADLLGKCPVARYEAGGRWGIFGYAEVAKAAADYKTFSNVTVPIDSPRILPLMADPPEHAPYRRLINPFFAAGPIAAVEAEVRPIAGEIIDAMIAAGTADFAQQYAYQFSTRTLCRLLQVKEDWQVYNDWSSEIERLTASGTAENASAGLPMDALMQIVPYLQGLIDARRAAPGDDVVSGIITGEIGGEALDDQAIVGLLIALILAGRSTTASGIGNLVLRVAGDAGLQQLLREHPDRIPDAVEESLRIDTPQQEMPRKCLVDVEIGGQTIKAGDDVFVNYGSANVDPAFWDEPGTFDIDRHPNRHMGFGRGPHLCFGAPLARMEMRVTLEELLARTTSFEVAGDVRRLTWPRLSVEELPLKLVSPA